MQIAAQEPLLGLAPSVELCGHGERHGRRGSRLVDLAEGASHQVPAHIDGERIELISDPLVEMYGKVVL